MNARRPLSGGVKRSCARIIAVLCLSGVLVSCSSYTDPSDTIEDDYERASQLDDGDGRAYTSSLRPSEVADEISDHAEPRDQRRNVNDYYLQYSKHIVAIAPYEGGSMILLDDYDDGYRRHSTIVRTWGWSSSPPASFRGGGPGSGK